MTFINDVDINVNNRQLWQNLGKRKGNSKTMGMSSSQARLLTLTARMHDIERKAQRIQAEKLRLANESDKVYGDYLLALDAKKLQYRAIASDGSVTFKEATMNALQNGIAPGWGGDTCQEPLFLQGLDDGRIFITPFVANKYGLSETEVQNKTLDEYLSDLGFEQDYTQITESQFKGYDYDKVTAFCPAAVTDTPPVLPEPVMTPLDNVDGSEVINYNDFQIASVKEHPIDTSELEEFTSSTVLTADEGKSYKISSVQSFMELNEYLANYANSYSAKGNTFVLANNLDFSGVDFKNYKSATLYGTFDGNGYIMKNINIQKTAPIEEDFYWVYDLDSDGNIQLDSEGNPLRTVSHSTTKNGLIWGLFSTCNGGTIKNLGLDNYNANINTLYDSKITNHYPDGSVSSSTRTDWYYCGEFGSIAGTVTNGGMIENCWVNGKININDVPNSSNTHTGGISGTNQGTLNNCSVDITITNPGGQCIGGVSGHNDGVLTSCWVTGNVTGAIWTGGLVGHNEGVTTITDCITTARVSGMACVGAVVGCTTYASVPLGDQLNQSLWNIKDGYDIEDPEEKLNKIKTQLTIDNIVYDPTLNPSLTKIGDCADIGTDTSFKTLVTTPSVDPTTYEGGFYSNVYGALIHSGKLPTDIDESKVKEYVGNLLNAEDGGLKIANINRLLYNYMSGTSVENPLITAIFNDIENGSISQSTAAAYMTTYDVDHYKSVVPTDTSDAWSPYTTASSPGLVHAPSFDTIKEELKLLAKKSGADVTDADIDTFMSKYDVSGSSEAQEKDKIYLANIAKMIAKGDNMNTVWTLIKNGDKYSDDNVYYPYSQYRAVLSGDPDLNPEYEELYEDVEIGRNYFWDTSDPDIAAAISMWTFSKRGIRVLTEAEASDPQFVFNYITNNAAVLTKFDPSRATAISGLSEEELASLTDDAYDSLMGIEFSSVATNLNVAEVVNEAAIKKAEAEYEAKMRRINQKDARYDQQLSVCETERQAIKDEMDTLKTVIKDNVNLNFKLFS